MPSFGKQHLSPIHLTKVAAYNIFLFFLKRHHLGFLRSGIFKQQ